MLPLHAQLSGPNAFYNQPNYAEKTKEDFSSKGPLNEVNFVYESEDYQPESTIYKIGKIVLSIIVFPIGLYYVLHALIGRMVVPSSYLSGCNLRNARVEALEANLKEGWAMKRITVQVNGSKVDAMIMGKAANLNNGRWMLPSMGNGEPYEMLMHNSDYTKLAEKLDSNILFFNYCDRCFPSRDSITNIYKAMLANLEDDKEGIGAKEIIMFGRSLGGVLQGRALLNHPLKLDKINYVAIKSQTLSKLSTTVSNICCFLYGSLIKASGWEMDGLESSINLQCPEIIIQTVDTDKHPDVEEPIKDIEDIDSDGVIPAAAAHATALLAVPGMADCKDKAFIAVHAHHNEPITQHLDRIAKKTNEYLQQQTMARITLT